MKHRSRTRFSLNIRTKRQRKVRRKTLQVRLRSGLIYCVIYKGFELWQAFQILDDFRVHLHL